MTHLRQSSLRSRFGGVGDYGGRDSAPREKGGPEKVKSRGQVQQSDSHAADRTGLTDKPCEITRKEDPPRKVDVSHGLNSRRASIQAWNEFAVRCRTGGTGKGKR